MPRPTGGAGRAAPRGGQAGSRSSSTSSRSRVTTGYVCEHNIGVHWPGGSAERSAARCRRPRSGSRRSTRLPRTASRPASGPGRACRCCGTRSELAPVELHQLIHAGGFRRRAAAHLVDELGRGKREAAGSSAARRRAYSSACRCCPPRRPSRRSARDRSRAHRGARAASRARCGAARRRYRARVRADRVDPRRPRRACRRCRRTTARAHVAGRSTSARGRCAAPPPRRSLGQIGAARATRVLVVELGRARVNVRLEDGVLRVAVARL